MSPIDFSLYLITDRTLTNGRPLAAVVRQALSGGVRAVQLREKDLPAAELYALAGELRRITQECGAKLFINDRIDIARAVAADGIHLGAASIPLAVARGLAGSEMLIGYSAHAADEALRAEREGADFVTIGPVYPTPSKAVYGPPLGLDPLSAAVRLLSIPVFALGGIKRDTLGEVMAAGARGIALISAVIGAPDSREAAATLLRTIEDHVNPA